MTVPNLLWCLDSPSFSAFVHGPVFDDKVKTVMIIPSLSLMFTSSLSLYLVWKQTSTVQWWCPSMAEQIFYTVNAWRDYDESNLKFDQDRFDSVYKVKAWWNSIDSLLMIQPTKDKTNNQVNQTMWLISKAEFVEQTMMTWQWAILMMSSWAWSELSRWSAVMTSSWIDWRNRWYWYDSKL